MRSDSPWEMIWWPDEPMFTEARRLCMSLSLTSDPFKIYLFTPSGYTSREMLTVSKFRFISSPPSFESLKTLSSLLKYIETYARDPFDKFFEPFQIRSLPVLPRMDFIDCSPTT